jgi:hypothetical protein
MWDTVSAFHHVSTLPGEAHTGTYRVDEVTRDGLLVLNVAADVDRRFGGFMNDIRVEPRYVRVILDRAKSGRALERRRTPRR